jgi:hypothetical protein
VWFKVLKIAKVATYLKEEVKPLSCERPSLLDFFRGALRIGVMPPR